MNLNETQRYMLAAIAMEPRRAQHFTNSKVHSPLTEKNCRLFLDGMVEGGLLDCEGDRYSITAEGREALETSRLTPSAIYGNATTAGLYVPARSYVREGAERFKGLPSVGLGC